MSILNRFSVIMKSNIHALLDGLEDPSKIVDQTLRDLRNDLAEVKKETAGVMANEKNAKRLLEECDADISQYTLAAQNALIAGNEEDAKTLIKKKQQFEKKKESLEENYALAKSNADKMRQMHDKLVDDIDELEIRKEAIKAKVATAKAQQQLNKVIAGGKGKESSHSAFERMEARADRMLDTAEAMTELNEDGDKKNSLLDQYTGKGSETEVDLELAQMRAKLGLE
ncbi:MAG: PspA/IM30 family protein [Lachnospiraceae bacterium]|nr:PspA/IM30 family protein [Lachnospiraceae bacterium]